MEEESLRLIAFLSALRSEARYFVKKVMSFALSGQRLIEISQSGGGSLTDSEDGGQQGQRTADRTWLVGWVRNEGAET